MVTMTKTVLVLVLALASAACMGGGGRRPSVSASQPPPLSPVEAALLGQWELVGIEAQGRPLQGSGRLSYDQFNNIAVHAELAPGEAGVTPPRVVLLDFAAKAAVSGPDELTFMGLERRAPADQMVPQASEPSAWRHFAIEGDTLRVWQENPNGQAAGVMTFRRVR